MCAPVCTCTSGSDCLTEIGILTLQHPSVSRKSRIQCLASHTFSGFRRWNVVISHARVCALPRTHAQAHTHTYADSRKQKTKKQIVSGRCKEARVSIFTCTHSALQRGECGFVRKCQLPQASAHLYFTAFRHSQFFHRMLKTIFPGPPPLPTTHFSLFITAHNSSSSNGPSFFFFFSLSKIRTLQIYRGGRRFGVGWGGGEA